MGLIFSRTIKLALSGLYSPYHRTEVQSTEPDQRDFDFDPPLLEKQDRWFFLEQDRWFFLELALSGLYSPYHRTEVQSTERDPWDFHPPLWEKPDPWDFDFDPPLWEKQDPWYFSELALRGLYSPYHRTEVQSTEMEDEYCKMKSNMEDEYCKMKSDMEDEYCKMKSDMKDEYFKMKSDMEDQYFSRMRKKISLMKSVTKRDWMTLKMNNEVSKMNSDIKKEFDKMSRDMKYEFQKMSQDMKNEFQKKSQGIKKEFDEMSRDMKYEFQKMSRDTKRDWMTLKMNNEVSKMNSDIKKEFDEMSRDTKRDWMTLKMNNEVSKMNSDIKKEFDKMSRDIKNKISKIRSDMNDEFSNIISKKENCFSKMRSEIKNQSSRMRSDLAIKQKRRYHWIIRDPGSSDADTNGREMTVERQKIHKNYNYSCHGTKLMKSALRLAYTVLPCAGGTDPGRSQRGNQDHSQIYQASLKFVSKCPLSSEYMNKTLEKCVDVCGRYIKDGNCTYHCMRDSSKTRLVEFCARPKILFEFCPEYDPVDQTFQKDTASLCNSTSNHTYYTSSDIYFCNPDNCLQLLESDVRSSATTLMTEATEMNGGDIQEVWPLQIWPLILLLVVVVIVLAIFLACILHKRRHLRDRPRKEKMTKNVETVMQKLVKG